MPVYRSNDPHKSFLRMSNHSTRNKELSLRAKGLMTVLMDLPPNWRFSVAGFSKIMPDGPMPFAPPCGNWKVRAIWNASAKLVQTADPTWSTISTRCRKRPCYYHQRKNNLIVPNQKGNRSFSTGVKLRFPLRYGCVIQASSSQPGCRRRSAPSQCPCWPCPGH